jgi:hypothetical protein
LYGDFNRPCLTRGISTNIVGVTANKVLTTLNGITTNQEEINEKLLANNTIEGLGTFLDVTEVDGGATTDLIVPIQFSNLNTNDKFALNVPVLTSPNKNIRIGFDDGTTISYYLLQNVDETENISGIRISGRHIFITIEGLYVSYNGSSNTNEELASKIATKFDYDDATLNQMRDVTPINNPAILLQNSNREIIQFPITSAEDNTVITLTSNQSQSLITLEDVNFQLSDIKATSSFNNTGNFIDILATSPTSVFEPRVNMIVESNATPFVPITVTFTLYRRNDSNGQIWASLGAPYTVTKTLTGLGKRVFNDVLPTLPLDPNDNEQLKLVATSSGGGVGYFANILSGSKLQVSNLNEDDITVNIPQRYIEGLLQSLSDLQTLIDDLTPVQLFFNNNNNQGVNVPISPGNLDISLSQSVNNFRKFEVTMQIGGSANQPSSSRVQIYSFSGEYMGDATGSTSINVGTSTNGNPYYVRIGLINNGNTVRFQNPSVFLNISNDVDNYTTLFIKEIVGIK